MNDQSQSAASLYAGRKWVAQTLGISVHTFDSKRPKLEEQGFPKRDALVGLYIKADVIAWVDRRRQLADKIEHSQPSNQEHSINEDEL